MNEDLILTLQNYGFSEKEAKIYLTALSLGAAPASSIARNANESRTTVYSVLGDLVKKGYCSTVVRENVTYFSAVSPEILVKLQEQKYKSIKEKLPEFMALDTVLLNHPKVKYYEGVEGIKSLYESSLNYKQPVFAFLSDSVIHPGLQKYLNEDFIKKRQSKGIHASVLVSEASVEYLGKTEKDDLTDTKAIKQSILGLEGEIIMYGENNVLCAMYSPQELSGFSIQSRQLYSTLKSVFNFIWNSIPNE